MLLLCAVLATWQAPVPVQAADGDAVGGFRGFVSELVEQFDSPWFWFGMTAQFTFLMRFIIQWIVSERRKRSTVPIAFWYFSLAGGLSLFFYACHKVDPVIMFGQLLACVIYVRNLMLIHGWRRRRRQAGLPVGPASEADDAVS